MPPVKRTRPHDTELGLDDPRSTTVIAADGACDAITDSGMAHSATETSEHHIVRVTATADDDEMLQSSPALRRTSIAFKRSASRPYLFDS